MIHTAAILLSRQALRPNGQTPWVRQTRLAVARVQKIGLGLTSSIGMQTWELITALGAMNNIPLWLTVPVSSPDRDGRTRDHIIADYDLKPDRVTITTVASTVGSADRHHLMAARDRNIVAQADMLMPIALRPDSSLRGLVTDAESRGVRVHREFEIPYYPHGRGLAIDYSQLAVTPELQTLDDRYLIHWTRGTNGRWPGERAIDYYRDLLASDTWCRSALHTLTRIVETRTVLASAHKMPARTPCVSLSGLRPVDVLPLMTWRARYRQMSFEPYGIGIRREEAMQYGIQPVWYHDRMNNSEKLPDDAWRWQSIGQKTDWRRECEYRMRGDLDLRVFPRAALRLFCRTGEEAERLQSRFGLPVTSFEA
ncbi:MAG: hypothetical protein KKA42_16890 [candidate division Zixibacteria bacterium]|nr:hypothetical protein [candidate division Zixibacteria bacterium]